MVRETAQSLAMIAVLTLAAGCGGGTAPTTTESSATAGSPEIAAEGTTASDLTPVLPIPDDLPAEPAQPAAATIKPIPDDE